MFSARLFLETQTQCREPGVPVPAQVPSMPDAQSRHSITTASRPESPELERSASAVPPAAAPVDSPASSVSGATGAQPQLQQQPSRDVLGGGNPFLNRRPTDESGQPVTAGSLARSLFSRSSSQAQDGGPDDGEDTMKNLRKTFAGIFGDM